MNEESNSTHGMKQDQNTIEILTAKIIPTSHYFDARFDHLKYQLDELVGNILKLL